MSCDAQDLGEGAGIVEVLQDEGGDVSAGDAADESHGLRSDDLDGVGDGTIGEAGRADNGPVKGAGAELGFHPRFVGHGSAEEGGDEGAIERWGVDDAVADTDGRDGEDAADFVALHRGDEIAGDVGFERGFEEGPARADGVDDGLLRGDSGVDEFRVARVSLEDAGTVHGLRGCVMHKCGDFVAEVAGLPDKGVAELAVGADDEEIQAELRAIGSPGSWMQAPVEVCGVQRYGLATGDLTIGIPPWR